jgi:hypothetical protein
MLSSAMSVPSPSWRHWPAPVDHDDLDVIARHGRFPCSAGPAGGTFRINRSDRRHLFRKGPRRSEQVVHLCAGLHPALELELRIDGV